MKVRFTNPGKMLEGEERSKLLDPTSSLYHWLQAERMRVTDTFGPDAVAPKRMDFHIELLKERGLGEGPLVQRAQQVEGHAVDTSETRCWGRAYVLIIGREVENLHVTIAFFPGGVPQQLAAGQT